MIIIPDIHGRSFWHDAVEAESTEEIIFLGDYTDPYPHEGIAPEKGLETLTDVLRLKADHPERTTLLLGNHDLSYISSHLPQCRHDHRNHDTIRQILLDNLDQFDIAHEIQVADRHIIFTHAGILPQWLKANEPVLGPIPPGHECTALNQHFHDGTLYPALGNLSWYRGGTDETGSCVWADINEHIRSNTHLSGYYQIFGHTQMKEPLIETHFASLDCRQTFRLDDLLIRWGH